MSYIRVAVTHRCNLQCAYCVSGDGGLIYPNQHDILQLREITRLIRIFAPLGIRKVRLTGGEPLMRKGLYTLIKNLKGIEGIEEITMTTNGVALKKMIPKLRDAGLDRINISLDSLKPERIEKITGSDVFGLVMETIEHIAENGIWPVKINVVAIRGFNDDEVTDFADLAAKMPIEVRFIEMMPTAHNRLWDGKSAIPCDEIKKAIARKHELVSEKKHRLGGPAEVYKIKNGAGKVGFISAISKHFCSECNRLRLTAEGQLRSCLFSDAEVDLSEGFRRGETDGWFLKKLDEALQIKPEGHRLKPTTPTSPCDKPMISIGG